MKNDKHETFLYSSYHSYQRRHMPINLTASSSIHRQRFNKETGLPTDESCTHLPTDTFVTGNF